MGTFVDVFHTSQLITIEGRMDNTACNFTVLISSESIMLGYYIFI